MRVIARLLPKGTKVWLASKFALSLARFSLVKYGPHEPGSVNYALPRIPRRSADTCELGLPIPPSRMWLGYGKTGKEYLSYGKSDVHKMLGILKESGFSLHSRDRILDFGCGAGRMTRWLKELATAREVWGVDINAEHIFWCQQHLSPPLNFVTTSTLPYLPFEDHYFGLIYAVSVFTQIDDLARTWFVVFKRILSPEGRLFVTIHDKHTLTVLEKMKDHPFSRFVRAKRRYIQRVRSDSGMFTIGRGVDSQVFYDLGYFQDMLSPLFRIVSVEEEAHGYQTGVLLEPMRG
jgi:SAM-dependent methyltransferase